MLPPTTAFKFACWIILPTKLVTVPLALLPVIAIIGARACCANNSISPKGLSLRALMIVRSVVSLRSMPGLTINSLQC